jgi:ubiquinone/menaquinone biosynthesis C-methylase UbiE
MANSILNWIAPIHRRLRAQKCEIFFAALDPSPYDSLLDVGGSTGILGEFEKLYRFFHSVQVVNLDGQCFRDVRLRHVQFDIGDGCSLRYPDSSFDWVFSNAVIEHVGNRARQIQFASEIQRVARKGYFVATPNRYFPIDPHTLLPCFQFLKPAWQRRICRFSPGYLKHFEPINLLSERDLSEMFPDAKLHKCGLPIFPNNLVAHHRQAPTEHSPGHIQ